MSKERQYTDMQLAFLAALRDKDNKGNLKKCMNIAGYGETVSPSVIIKSLHEEITQVAQELIGAHAVQATISVVELLDDPANLNAQTILKAAKEVLDRAGVAKKESNLEVKVGSGLVILPAKDVPSENDFVKS